MTLRTKFQLASTSLILIVIFGMMGSLYLYEKKQIRTRIQIEQEKELAKLAEFYQEADFSGELGYIDYIETLVLSNPMIAFAGQIRPNYGGFIWVQGENQIRTDGFDTDRVQEILNSKKLLRNQYSFKTIGQVEELSKPVRHDIRRDYIGHVRLAYSKDEVNNLINKNTRDTSIRLIIVGLVVIIFGLFLVQIFTGALSKPIDQLMRAAIKISKGKKGVQIPEGNSSDELARLTKTFNKMSRELSKLDELKDEFMSHVSHELRSPLTSIIATVELLAENPKVQSDPKFKRSIDRLVYGSERLNRLVDNILDLTKLEAGKMPFDIQPTNMADLISEMADFFEPRAMEKGLKIKAVVKKNLPDAMADSEKVRQAISNLVHNAIKFTNKGSITLSAKEDDGFILVGIKDTGVGIPEDKRDRVFQKFESLKHTRDAVDKPVPGSGLGLNIVRNSIEKMGGKIWVESEVDKGSTFFFTLPIPKDSPSKSQSSDAQKSKKDFSTDEDDHLDPSDVMNEVSASSTEK